MLKICVIRGYLCIVSVELTWKLHGDWLYQYIIFILMIMMIIIIAHMFCYLISMTMVSTIINIL